MSIYKTKSLAGITAALSLSMGMVACSGSGKAPATQTGQFIDAAVIGANYTASPSGFSGQTDGSGNYNYLPGDSVVFSIGNIVFPAVTAKGTVTPLDIADTTDINNTTVVNIARLLQTLDTDNDPSNGITLDSSVTGSAYDFTQSVTAFEAAFKADFPSLNLITEADALAHLQTELAALAGNSSGGGTCAAEAAAGPNETAAVIPASIAGTYTVTFSESEVGSNIVDGSSATFVVKEDGTLEIEGGVTLCAPVLFAENAHEAIWKDKANGLTYALSSLLDGFNEINVGSFTEGEAIYGVGFTFYGQYSNKK